MKKEKITLNAGDKMIYFAPLFKPSMQTIKEVTDRNILLDNQVRIKIKPNKEGEFERVTGLGFALPVNEESQKVFDAANAYYRIEDLRLNELYQKIITGRDQDAVDRMLKIKRLYDKIMKLIGE